MKPNFYIPLLAFGMALLFMLSSCGSDTKVNFLLNEQDFPRILTDSMPNDSDNVAVYQIYQGDTVVFKDVTEPLNAVDSRFWNLDGEEGWESRDEEFTEYVYHDLGLVTVVLCVNDTTNCVAKAIFVREAPPDFTPEPAPRPEPKPEPRPDPGPKPPKPQKKPELKFILPNVYSTNTNDDEFPIRVRVGYVSQKNDLTLLVNGEKFTAFSLSRGQLSGKVPLNPGKNLVVLTATNSAGTATEEKEFIYSPKATVTPSIGFITPSALATTTSNEKYDIVVASVNVTKKEQVSLTLNGQAIKDFSFSPNTGEIKAKLALKKGDNRIVASVGSISSEVKVTLESGGGGVKFTGVPSKEINTGSCDDFSVGSGSMTITPSRSVRLMGATVFSSDCGSLTIKLSGGGGGKVSESFELSQNKSQLVFNTLDGLELEAGNTYTLSYTTGKSSDCPKGAPQLLNAKSCGKNSSGDQSLEIGYDGKVCLFSLKYQ